MQKIKLVCCPKTDNQYGLSGNNSEFGLTKVWFCLFSCFDLIFITQDEHTKLAVTKINYIEQVRKVALKYVQMSDLPREISSEQFSDATVIDKFFQLRYVTRRKHTGIILCTL